MSEVKALLRAMAPVMCQWRTRSKCPNRATLVIRGSGGLVSISQFIDRVGIETWHIDPITSTVSRILLPVCETCIRLPDGPRTWAVYTDLTIDEIDWMWREETR